MLGLIVFVFARCCMIGKKIIRTLINKLRTGTLTEAVSLLGPISSACRHRFLPAPRPGLDGAGDKRNETKEKGPCIKQQKLGSQY